MKKMIFNFALGMTLSTSAVAAGGGSVGSNGTVLYSNYTYVNRETYFETAKLRRQEAQANELKSDKIFDTLMSSKMLSAILGKSKLNKIESTKFYTNSKCESAELQTDDDVIPGQGRYGGDIRNSNSGLCSESLKTKYFIDLKGPVGVKKNDRNNMEYAVIGQETYEIALENGKLIINLVKSETEQ